MLLKARLGSGSLLRGLGTAPTLHTRNIMTQSSSNAPTKAAGDISSVFPSLSGAAGTPLPPRFAELKSQLISGHEEELRASWEDLLSSLKQETEIIQALGPAVIPELDCRDLGNMERRTKFSDDLRKRGVAVIRNVVSAEEALGWKELVKRYIKTNPLIKGFPADRPVVYELYWSPSQILARSHPNLLKTQSFLMSHWHSADKSALLSTSHPASYADRLRIRQPGDAGFSLGPHVDSGSCERWEPNGYGQGGVYNEIWKGNWRAYDPWEASCRLSMVSDLYNGAGACSMFRMFQGWLSMSETNPGEGTLKVNPLLGKATAYFLLRPFFEPNKGPKEVPGSAFLESSNWRMQEKFTPVLQGAVPSNCQELNDALHPHLDLEHTMVHVPPINPGDYVAWHCDTIHAVDKIHAGKTNSSVMYIPACPLTEANAEYLVRQREAFFEGSPAPDFPSGEGEGQFMGRLTPDYFMKSIDLDGLRAMGLAKYDSSAPCLLPQERKTLERANKILGFA